MHLLKIIHYIFNFILVFCAIGLVSLQGNVDNSVVQSGNMGANAVSIDENILYFFPQAVSLTTPTDSIWTEIHDREDKKVGYVVYSSPYSNNIYGFGGNTPLIIALNKKQKIIGTKLLENHETPSYVNHVSEEGLFESWNGLSINAALNKEVDAISGATYTSKAVIDSFHKRMSVLNSNKYHGRESLLSIKNVCTLLVILFAVFCFFKPQIMKSYRLYFLGLSVIVLGVWQGLFLSVSGIYAGLSNPVSFYSRHAFLIILVLSVVMPFLTRRQFYCAWLCPFGALQELTDKLNKHKLHIPTAIVNGLLFLRKCILLLIVFLLITGIVTDISPIEPFSVFTIKSASNFILIFGGFFLILSAFVKKPWCRYFCPTGQLLDVFRTISFKNIRS
jgi:hypothetical protein